MEYGGPCFPDLMTFDKAYSKSESIIKAFHSQTQRTCFLKRGYSGRRGHL